jgi:SAM-dependent methyltransferase
VPYDPKSYWNTRARRYASDPLRAACLDDIDESRCIDGVQRALLRQAVRRLGGRAQLHGKVVLDFGCGSGRWVAFLRSYGLVYSGVDIAEDMLVIARRQHPDADLRPVDGSVIPYADRSVDLVWSVAVVHHNPYDVQERILAEMMRVLRPRGWLILFEGLGSHAASGENYFPRPLSEWCELAAAGGLTCAWQRGATYLLLRPLATRVESRLRRAQLNTWRRLLTRLDAIVDPYLLPFLPQRHHTRAVMLFRKDVAGG